MLIKLLGVNGRICRLPLVVSLWTALLLAFPWSVPGSSASFWDASTRILIGDYDGTFESIQFLNAEVGADIYYNAGFFGEGAIIANIESGHVWGGHEVFDRSGLGLPSSPFLTFNATIDPSEAPNLGELDFHATMVAHVLAGTGLVDNNNLSLLGAGMAPLAELWSGAIATHFSSENIGSFSVSDESFLAPYKEFFSGGPGAKPDVINSSWGFPDLNGTSYQVQSLDGMAAAHPDVALVVAAGNDGPDSETVSALGTGFNSIAVGALGEVNESTGRRPPSSFSAVGPAGFWNPETETLTPGVRATIHLSAPGENFALAYYGGETGALASIVEPTDPLPTDFYFTFNQSGTSFSAPVVAGAIALMKEAANDPMILGGVAEIHDTRVIRSILMAGSRRTEGWDNAQQVVDGVVRTSQALDWATGAGEIDLVRSTNIMLGDAVGSASGNETIFENGWLLGSVSVNGQDDYRFAGSLIEPVELSVSLNWFSHVNFDFDTDEVELLGFANLDLEIWEVLDGDFVELVAISESLYNSSEFLRTLLDAGTQYGIRVNHQGMVYDLTDEEILAETYGLAWHMEVIPEPATITLLTALLLTFTILRLRKRHPSSCSSCSSW